MRGDRLRAADSDELSRVAWRAWRTTVTLSIAAVLAAAMLPGWWALGSILVLAGAAWWAWRASAANHELRLRRRSAGGPAKPDEGLSVDVSDVRLPGVECAVCGEDVGNPGRGTGR